MQCDVKHTDRNYCKQSPGGALSSGRDTKAKPRPHPRRQGYMMLLERLCSKIKLKQEGSGRSLSAILLLTFRLWCGMEWAEPTVPL